MSDKNKLVELYEYLDEGCDETSALTGEFQLYRLKPMQQRFVNLYMTGQYTIAQLSELLDLHPNTLYKWLKGSKEVQDSIKEMTQLQKDIVALNINALTVKAVQTMNGLLDSPIDGVKYQAAKDILDRGGHKTKQEIDVKKTVTYEEKLHQIIDDYIEAEVVEDE